MVGSSIFTFGDLRFSFQKVGYNKDGKFYLNGLIPFYFIFQGLVTGLNDNKKMSYTMEKTCRIWSFIRIANFIVSQDIVINHTQIRWACPALNAYITSIAMWQGMYLQWAPNRLTWHASKVTWHRIYIQPVVYSHLFLFQIQVPFNSFHCPQFKFGIGDLFVMLGVLNKLVFTEI